VGSSALGVCSATYRTDAPNTSVNPGWLMPTGNVGNRTGGIVYNQALPASAGLQVTFDQVQYGGSGADGISFFLSDGSYQLTQTGAPGGSLGYARRDNGATVEPGVVGGFLGLALDAWGNYPRATEARGTGCPSGTAGSTSTTEIKNNVSLRGPGWQDGAGAWTQGYCLLATSGAMSTSTKNLRGSGVADYRSVRITVSPTTYSGTTPTTTITVDMNFTPSGGGSFQNVFTTTTHEEVPATYKFGFAASTGGSTDVHLIRNLAVWDCCTSR